MAPPAYRGLFRIKGQNKAQVSDGDNSQEMSRKDYDAANIQPPWEDLKEVDPAGELPQPQRGIPRPKGR